MQDHKQNPPHQLEGESLDEFKRRVRLRFFRYGSRRREMSEAERKAEEQWLAQLPEWLQLDLVM